MNFRTCPTCGWLLYTPDERRAMLGELKRLVFVRDGNTYLTYLGKLMDHLQREQDWQTGHEAMEVK